MKVTIQSNIPDDIRVNHELSDEKITKSTLLTLQKTCSLQLFSFKQIFDDITLEHK